MDILSEVESKIKNKSYTLKENSAGKGGVWERFYCVIDDTGQKTEFVQCKTGKCLLRTSTTSALARHKCIRSPSRQESASCSRSIPTPVKHKLTEAFVKMCTLDLPPLNAISSKGFQMVAQELINIGSDFGKVNAFEVLPPRSTVSRRCHEVADDIRLSVIPEVRKAMQDCSCAATTNLWTDNNKKNNFVSLTVHYIDEWTVKNRLLLTYLLPNSDENTIKKLTDQCALLGIQVVDLKRVTFVTDQVENDRKALTVSKGFTSVPCVGHCLKAVMEHTFQENFLESQAQDIQHLMVDIEVVVDYFKRTGLVSHLEYTLYQDTEANWNNKLLMLKSVRDQYDKMIEVLSPTSAGDKGRKRCMLEEIDKELMSDLINFLEPLKEAMDDLQGRCLTIQNVLVWYHHLGSHCEETSNDKISLKKIKERTLTFLKEKMVIHIYHKIATFLSPWFCQLKMLSEPEKEEILNEVRCLCKVLGEEQGLQSPKEPPRKTGRFKKWKNDLQEMPVDEVLLYMATAQKEPGDENDVLGWWKMHAHEFPRLSRVVKKIFCIPATCAASEHIFNPVDYHERRTCLNPEDVNDLLFLHSNMNFEQEPGCAEVVEEAFDNSGCKDIAPDIQEIVEIPATTTSKRRRSKKYLSWKQMHHNVESNLLTSELMLVDDKEEIADPELSVASYIISQPMELVPQLVQRPNVEDNEVEEQNILVDPEQVFIKVEKEPF